jgi:hypothetical protein
MSEEVDRLYDRWRELMKDLEEAEREFKDAQEELNQVHREKDEFIAHILFGIR